MSVWGKVVGAVAGLAVGGPIGAVLGGVAGHYVIDRFLGQKIHDLIDRLLGERILKMNHFLVSVLGILNSVIAVAIILGSATLAGYGLSPANIQQVTESSQLPPFSIGGAIVGAVMGLAIAAIVCGLFAIAISIEKSLNAIAAKAEVFDPGYSIEKSLKTIATVATEETERPSAP